MKFRMALIVGLALVGLWLGAPAEAREPQAPVAAAPQAAAVKPQDATNRPVRISFTNGKSRTATFVALSATDVTVTERGQTVRYALKEVANVRLVTHSTRNFALIGAVGGFLGGWLGSCGTGDEDDCWPEIGAMFAGIGAVAGAVIGHVRSRATEAKRTLYAGTRSTLTVAPLVGNDRRGIRFTMRW